MGATKFDFLFKDSQVSTICPRRSPGHHIEMHMWLIDRLMAYLKIQMWETWHVANGKGLFAWKPSNVKRLAKLIRQSCSVMPKPKEARYLILKHLILKADELTCMVYLSL